jgi:hypothetical protein
LLETKELLQWLILIRTPLHVHSLDPNPSVQVLYFEGCPLCLSKILLREQDNLVAKTC